MNLADVYLSRPVTRDGRLIVRCTAERSCWVALPPALSNHLLNANMRLPLVLRLLVADGPGPPSGRPCYVAWAGATSSGGQSLEVPAMLARCLGLREGATVLVEAVPHVAEATSVTLEPAAEDDWEVVEANAELIEQQMLNQVGLVVQGQPFPLWIRQAAVSLRATALAPPEPVVRLAAGCEVLVAPKVRVRGAPQPLPGLPPSASPADKQAQADSVPEHAVMLRIHAASAATYLLQLLGPGNERRAVPASNGGRGGQPAPAPDSRPPVDGVLPSSHAERLRSHAMASSSAARGQQSTGSHRGPAAAAASVGGAAAAGVAAAAAQEEDGGTAVGTTWLTTAVGASSETASVAGLLLGAPVALQTSSGTLRSIPVLLLRDETVLFGHVALSPPLRTCLGLHPHMHVKVAQRGVGPRPTPGLPLLTLHPVRLEGGANGSQKDADAAPPAAGGPRAAESQEGAGGGGEVLTAVATAARPAAKQGGDGSLGSAAAANKPVVTSGKLAGGAEAVSLQELLDSSAQQALQSWVRAQAVGAAVLAAVVVPPAAPASSKALDSHMPAPGLSAAGPSSSAQQPRQGGKEQATGSGDELPESLNALAASGVKGSGSMAGEAATEMSAGGRPGPGGTPAAAGVLLGSGSVVHICASESRADNPLEHLFILRLDAAKGGAGGEHGCVMVSAPWHAEAHPNPNTPSDTPQVRLRSAVNVEVPHLPTQPHAKFLGPPTYTTEGPAASAGTAQQPGSLGWMQDEMEGALRRLAPQLDLRTWLQLGGRDVPRAGGVLVTGGPGSGRSLLLQTAGELLAKDPQRCAHVVHVSCRQLAGSQQSAVRRALAAAVAECASCWPALLLLDDLDALCPSAEGADGAPPDAHSTAHAQWLADALDELGATGVPVAWAASCREASALPAVLRQARLFDFSVALPAPGALARTSILAASLQSRGACFQQHQLEGIAARAEGFDASDLQVLMERAVLAALARHLGHAPGSIPSKGRLESAMAAAPAPPRLDIQDEDLAQAFEGYVPAAFWGVQQAKADAQRIEGWEDVGGLHELRAALYESLEIPLKMAGLVAAAPLRLRTGVLLFGPPGCGKTHAVAAAVAALGVRFIAVKGPELLNKYIGASEAAVRDTFRRAAAAAPCVLFFDEFDAIAPPRGHDSTGVTDRVVNQLLTQLDGIEALSGVYVLAATSRPDLIDAALLRPGRLDRLIHCPMPDELARLEILHALSRKLQLAPGVDLEELAEATEGFTGADLSGLLAEAQLDAVHEALHAAEESGAAPPAGRPAISMEHLHTALARARPSLPQAELSRLMGIYQRFLSSRDPGIGNRADAKGKRATLA